MLILCVNVGVGRFHWWILMHSTNKQYNNIWSTDGRTECERLSLYDTSTANLQQNYGKEINQPTIKKMYWKHRNIRIIWMSRTIKRKAIPFIFTQYGLFEFVLIGCNFCGSRKTQYDRVIIHLPKSVFMIDSLKLKRSKPLKTLILQSFLWIKFFIYIFFLFYTHRFVCLFLFAS